MLEEVLSHLPNCSNGRLLDVTAGGGNHFFEILKQKFDWFGECWDFDPLAQKRIHEKSLKLKFENRIQFTSKNFIQPYVGPHKFDYILADLGVSSFQLDDLARGMSLKSQAPVDFRMNPNQGEKFDEWLDKKSESELVDILEKFGEEPKSKKLASEIKKLDKQIFQSSHMFAEKIAQILNYKSQSRIHPATRAFQAFRMSINKEFEALDSLLNWAPKVLSPGGRLAIISFHSIEDRLVKNMFSRLAQSQEFDILTSRPLVPSESEVSSNPRSRSAKLRIIQRR